MPRRGYPPHIQKAFDELRFGPLRTLNLRESLPTAQEARDRTERWNREGAGAGFARRALHDGGYSY